MLTLLFNSALLGIGLAMDAFSVSLANGLNEPCMKRRKMLGIAGLFAFFQGLMPMIGWVFVHTLLSYFYKIQKFIPCIALVLLVFIGVKMLIDGIKSKVDFFSADFTNKEKSYKIIRCKGDYCSAINDILKNCGLNFLGYD